MADNQMKILKYFRNADERGKALILDMLICATTFGDAFFEEMQEPTDKGDKNGVKAILAKYTAILKRGSGQDKTQSGLV